MVEVIWTDDAVVELLHRVPDRAVASQIHRVASTELPFHDPPDGGFGRHPLLWRRAITRDQRRAVDLAVAQGHLLDSLDDRAWRFLIVFRRTRDRELGRRQHEGFVVIAVLRDGHIAAGYEEIIETALPTMFAS